MQAYHKLYFLQFVYEQLAKADLLGRMLQLSVWDASSRLSNQCLAVASVELSAIDDTLFTGVEEEFVLQRPLHL